MADTDEQDDTMNSGLSVAERDVLQAKLHELPDTMPPRVVWHRIERQARAEGLLSGSRHQERMRWLVGAGIAAAVALAALRLPFLSGPMSEPPTFATEPPLAEAGNNNGLRAVNALMVQSQQLERDLRALPNQPHVMRAGTVATISELEDRIAAIDSRLNYSVNGLTPEQAEIYWRERVRLMDSLVRLRYAQAQRMSF